MLSRSIPIEVNMKNLLTIFSRLFVTTIFLIASNLGAQTPTGTISGTLKDESGAVIPSITVTATNLATGVTRTTMTNETGAYQIPALRVGTYRVEAQIEGVAARTVQVNVGTTSTADLLIRVGALAETITITADTPVVEATKSEVSSVVNERFIENLPTNGRNFIDFALTTPGVTRDVRAGDISFAGQRGTLNSLVVDGSDNNNTFFGQALGRTGSGRAPYQFSQDAVKEFQINSNAYSAEFGRAGGAVINVVTKSGTNEIDGSTFFFHRNEGLNSNDYINRLNNRRKSAYDFDQYGASVGGPFVRDRHFFFLNYDAQRNAVTNDVILTYRPINANDPDEAAGLARLQNLAIDYPRGQDQDVFLVKTDHELFANSRLSFRFNRQDFTGVNLENGGPTNSFEHTGNSLVETDTYTLTFSSPITSNFFNEVRGQYARDYEPGLANSANPEATIRQSGQTVLVIGRNFFSPRETTIKRLQFADTANLLFGRHSIRAGFDVNRDEILNFFPGNFSGAYTFASIASFNRGRPSGAGERYVQAFAGPGTSGPRTNPDLFETALFVQDEWRMSETLTFNLGLRYDYQDIEQPDVRNPDPQLLAAGIDTSVVPVDKDNIAPRLGFAWVPTFNPKSLIRGGYGIFYGRTPAIMVGTAHSNNGINVQTITFTGNQVPTYPNVFASIPTGAALPRPTIFVFDKDYENPMTHQASLGYEHALTDDIGLSVSYLFVQGNNLPRSTDINIGVPTIEQIPVAGGGTVPVKRFPTARPFTNFNRIVSFQSTADSEYNGLSLEATKRFSSNWQARLSYTYGRVKDNKPDATAVVPEGSDDAKFTSDPSDFSTDWTFGDNDVRHRAVLSGVWDLNYASSMMNGWARGLASGWALSGIVTYQSGTPYSAVVNADLNRDGNTRNDLAPGFRRNSERLPSILSVDPRITKTFSFGNAGLQLIAEAFNVLNADNVSGERNVFYAFTNGTLVPQTNVGLTSFGTPTATVGPRIVQVAAKFTF